jgi:ZIP family zinc transporter
MVSDTYITVLVLATLSGMTTVIGVWLAIYVSQHARWIAAGIGFSVGIMLLIALFELIPQSLALATTGNVVTAVLLGSGLIGALHYIIPHTHLFAEAGIIGNQALRSSYLVVLGLILHDFPEGFAMANAYITSPAMGISVAVAIALHNIPEEFAMAVPAAASKSRGFLFGAAILSGLAEPIGASIGLFASNISPDLVPLFMAFAAGAMIFVSLHELVPMARRYGRLEFFGLGLLVSIAVYMMLIMLFPE